MKAEIKEWSDMVKRKPMSSTIIFLLLTGGSGASVGALATKSYVEGRHSEAMSKISVLEQDSVRKDKQLERIENKLDTVILSIRAMR